MEAVSELTKRHDIKTIVSLNPIMVDGTGMCGACRVRVGDEIKFCCIDGPEFDAHQVDFISSPQVAVYERSGASCNSTGRWMRGWYSVTGRHFRQAIYW